MEKKLSDLYQDVILTNNKTPYHFEKAQEMSHSIEAYNPLCGDHFHVYFELENNTIKQAYFHGYGCAISKASTSVLLQQIEGKTLEEIRPIITEFLQIVHGEKTDSSQADFLAFAAAKYFPSRDQCATLAWGSLESFLKEASQSDKE